MGRDPKRWQPLPPRPPHHTRGRRQCARAQAGDLIASARTGARRRTSCSINQASTQPGTETGSGPYAGIVVAPLSLASSCTAAGMSSEATPARVFGPDKPRDATHGSPTCAAAYLVPGLASGRASAAVEAVHLVGRCVVDDGKEVAADAIPDGLHEALRGVGRNRGVDGIAARLEDIEGDLARPDAHGEAAGHAAGPGQR